MQAARRPRRTFSSQARMRLRIRQADRRGLRGWRRRGTTAAAGLGCRPRRGRSGPPLPQRTRTTTRSSGLFSRSSESDHAPAFGVENRRPGSALRAQPARYVAGLCRRRRGPAASGWAIRTGGTGRCRIDASGLARGTTGRARGRRAALRAASRPARCASPGGCRIEWRRAPRRPQPAVSAHVPADQSKLSQDEGDATACPRRFP